MERFYVHLEETLVDIEFLDPVAPRQLMSRLRRLYSRVRLDEMELNILRGILTGTQKWVEKARKP
jgi:tRNA (cytidine32/uridine32-2'-O)-methyltransferase